MQLLLALMHNLQLNHLDLQVRDLKVSFYFTLGCWVGAFNEKKISEILKLDADCHPVAILPIGHSNGKPWDFPKKTIKELVNNVK